MPRYIPPAAASNHQAGYITVPVKFATPPMGWQCPLCLTVLAPTEKTCDLCLVAGRTKRRG